MHEIEQFYEGILTTKLEVEFDINYHIQILRNGKYHPQCIHTILKNVSYINHDIKLLNEDINFLKKIYHHERAYHLLSEIELPIELTINPN